MRKKILIALSVVVIIITGIYIYLKIGANKDFAPLVKAKLTGLVKKASNGLYNLETDSVHLDITKGEITLFNVKLTVDSAVLAKLDAAKQAPDDVYSVSFKALNVNGIGPSDFLDKKNIDLNDIYLDDPVVDIFHKKRSYNYKSSDTSNLYSRIQSGVGHFSLKNLLVANVALTYHNLTKDSAVTKFKNLSFHFINILIDSTTQRDTSRFLYAEKAFIILRDYTIHTADSLYSFHLDSVALNAAANSMTVNGVSLKPRGNKSDFSSKLKYYTDRYDLNIDTAFVKGIDWYDLIAGERFAAAEVNLKKGNIEVFADRTLPDKIENKVGNYPQQMLLKIKMPVTVSKLTTAGFNVAYRELNPKSHKTGNLLFDNVRANFANLSNNIDTIAKHHDLVFTADSRFMNAANLHSVFTFDLSEIKNGNFTIDAKLGEMNGTKLNDVVEALASVEINSADIHELDIHIKADNNHSSGTIKFMYDNLKVSVLQADSEKNDPKKKALLTFLANAFIIKKSNTADDKNKDVKEVSWQRDVHKSFFSLIWKTIQQGITKTVKGTD